MAAKALLKSATDAFEAEDYEGVLRLVPSDEHPYPLLVCRGMAALKLQNWKVGDLEESRETIVGGTLIMQRDTSRFFGDVRWGVLPCSYTVLGESYLPVGK